MPDQRPIVRTDLATLVLSESEDIVQQVPSYRSFEASHSGSVATGWALASRGVAAALMLGAIAAQIGIGFLRCPEAKIQPVWAQGPRKCGS